MIDPTPLWDFDDPSGSEQRLRAAAEEVEGDDRLVLMTQVARALGLQEGTTRGTPSSTSSPPPRTRWRCGSCSSGAACCARPATPTGPGRTSRPPPRPPRRPRLDALHVDALHMLALVADPPSGSRSTCGRSASRRASSDPAARDWDATLLNNLGMAQADAGDFEAALTSFEDALAARTRIGDPRAPGSRGGWSPGRCVTSAVGSRRSMLQRHLRAELDAAGLNDSHVDDELAILEATASDPAVGQVGDRPAGVDALALELRDRPLGPALDHAAASAGSASSTSTICSA